MERGDGEHHPQHHGGDEHRVVERLARAGGRLVVARGHSGDHPHGGDQEGEQRQGRQPARIRERPKTLDEQEPADHEQVGGELPAGGGAGGDAVGRRCLPRRPSHRRSIHLRRIGCVVPLLKAGGNDLEGAPLLSFAGSALETGGAPESNGGGRLLRERNLAIAHSVTAKSWHAPPGTSQPTAMAANHVGTIDYVHYSRRGTRPSMGNSSDRTAPLKKQRSYLRLCPNCGMLPLRRTLGARPLRPGQVPQAAVPAAVKSVLQFTRCKRGRGGTSRRMRGRDAVDERTQAACRCASRSFAARGE